MFVLFDELKTAFGVQRATKLKELLVMNNIRFFTDIDGKPFTTVDALNASLNVHKKQANDDGFNLDILNAQKTD